MEEGADRPLTAGLSPVGRRPRHVTRVIRTIRPSWATSVASTGSLSVATEKLVNGGDDLTEFFATQLGSSEHS